MMPPMPNYLKGIFPEKRLLLTQSECLKKKPKLQAEPEYGFQLSKTTLCADSLTPGPDSLATLCDSFEYA